MKGLSLSTVGCSTLRSNRISRNYMNNIHVHLIILLKLNLFQLYKTNRPTTTPTTIATTTSATCTSTITSTTTSTTTSTATSTASPQSATQPAPQPAPQAAVLPLQRPAPQTAPRPVPLPALQPSVQRIQNQQCTQQTRPSQVSYASFCSMPDHQAPHFQPSLAGALIVCLHNTI